MKVKTSHIFFFCNVGVFASPIDLVKLTPNANQGLYISGGPMPQDNRYHLAELNFRWGDFRAQGSEHAINGEL